ncbi:MAG: hypothetical protein IPK92_14845 [Nitrospira sp.]|nr:hypothetical protein [Nitrospira sp.]
MLSSKKFEGVKRGTVTVAERSCVVEGVDGILQEAIDSVADGLAKQMALSSQIQEYAATKDTWKSIAGQSKPEPTAPISGAAVIPATAAPELTQPVQATPSEVVQPAHVKFRAIIRDESRDQFLDPDESSRLKSRSRMKGRWTP